MNAARKDRSKPDIAVIGQGPMGRAIVKRLAQAGHRARAIEPSRDRRPIVENAGMIILSLRSGVDGCRVLDTAELARGVHVVDTTTQETDDCLRAESICTRRGLSYSAGGVLGGVNQILEGQAVFLIGPELPPPITSVLNGLGDVIWFSNPTTACRAKLLHNLVLALSNHAIALCMHLASEAGIDRIESVLDRGTAGRIPSKSSVARDYRQGPSSSYTSALVAKDVAAILSSFPEVQSTKIFDLEELARLHRDSGDRPFTLRALQIFGGENECSSDSKAG